MVLTLKNHYYSVFSGVNTKYYYFIFSDISIEIPLLFVKTIFYCYQCQNIIIILVLVILPLKYHYYLLKLFFTDINIKISLSFY